MANIALG